MNFNWDIIGDKLFGILKGSGFKVQMFSGSGQKTLDPHEATRFFTTIPSKDPDLREFNVLISLHDEDSHSHIDIKTPNLKNQEDFDTVQRINTSIKRNLGDREGLSINWYKFDHTIRPKHEAYNNITESKDISKPYGSTKSSYQQIGDCKLIIRHTDPVDESKLGSRWRHIKAIFIETAQGERFRYPMMHVAGARAMARHLSNSGNMHDDIGQAIKSLSSDYMDLKSASRMLRSQGDESQTVAIQESLRDINRRVKRLSGPRGYAATTPSLVEKTDPDQDQMAKLHASLCEKCGCEPDDDRGRVLLVASKYLVEQGCTSGPEISFLIQPDLVSRASEFDDQRQRLAWQVSEMAGCVAEDMIKHRLANIADLLKAGEVIDPNDLDLIRTVFRASRDAGNYKPVPEIQRIKELGGF